MDYSVVCCNTLEGHILEPFGQIEDRLTDLYVKRYSWVFSEVLIEEIMALMSCESGFKIWHQIARTFN